MTRRFKILFSIREYLEGDLVAQFKQDKYHNSPLMFLCIKSGLLKPNPTDQEILEFLHKQELK